MGLFGRIRKNIRKLFSRSDSSSTSTDRFSHGARFDVATESNHVVQRSYQVEHNRHFNVSTSSERSSNVIDRPQATALHRSNTTSVTARASNASHRQPDANLERANSCKEFTLPNKYTSTNVSQFPHSTGSQKINVKVDSKISNEKNYGQKYPRPTTGIGESDRKAPKLNILQSTQKPECTKQTTNQNTLTSTRKVDHVNSSEFGRTTKPIIPSASISKASANREHRSTVEVHRNNTSKYTMPTTSEAKIAKEDTNTTTKPDLSIRMAAPSDPSHNPTGTTVSCHKSTSHNTPAISQQDTILNKKHTTQTLGNTKAFASVFSVAPHKIESRKLSDHNRGLGGFGNTQQSTPHKIENPKLSDHSRGIGKVFGNSQQSATLNKTNTTQISTNSKFAIASVVVPPITSYTCDSTAIPAPAVSMNYEPTIPQRTRTYIGVGNNVKAPGANLPKTQGISTGFHSVKGECIIKSHFKTVSIFKINAHQN